MGYLAQADLVIASDWLCTAVSPTDAKSAMLFHHDIRKFQQTACQADRSAHGIRAGHSKVLEKLATPPPALFTLPQKNMPMPPTHPTQQQATLCGQLHPHPLLQHGRPCHTSIT